MNIDGAWNPKNRNEGIGIVVRDVKGAFLAGMAKRWPNMTSAQIVEVAAVRGGIQFCSDIGSEGFKEVQELFSDAGYTRTGELCQIL
ncbi:hypothetical protein L1049_026658 [Liquidambar formosana]|uniref:RNase H type-1 domain-containing protein n=1 Tax=Liquidambar formosana TaxID=63359 RepID=A0AAP0NHE5_LIQFO